MPVRTPAASPRNSCRNDGMAATAVAPIMEESTGTSRQPRTSAPSSAQIFSTAAAAASAAAASAGRKATPTA